MMKRYTTFEEIDRDLKYLRLKSKIDKEETKLSLQYAKGSLNEVFSALGVIVGALGSIAAVAFIFKMVGKLVGINDKD